MWRGGGILKIKNHQKAQHNTILEAPSPAFCTYKSQALDTNIAIALLNTEKATSEAQLIPQGQSNDITLSILQIEPYLQRVKEHIRAEAAASC